MAILISEDVERFGKLIKPHHHHMTSLWKLVINY